jgi:hypothetical protein
MWISKDSGNIIYIDMETQLEVSPDVFCKNNQTPFRNAVFDTIFYDPPHTFGIYDHYHSYPRSTPEYFEKWHDKAIPRYYGWDKYKTSNELSIHIYKAQEEFYRILKDDGLLWLKWNEMSKKLSRILGLFQSWNVLMQLYVKNPSQTAGKWQTYWVCLEKIKRTGQQLTL